MIANNPQRFTTPMRHTGAWRRALGHPLPNVLLWLAACVLLPLLLSGCWGGGDDAPPPATASAAIGPTGGTLLGPDGVELTVPAGALARTTTLTITKTAAGAPALGGQLQAGGAIYEFTPHDLYFTVPVTIGFPLASSASTTSTLVSTSVFMVSPGEPEWGELETRVINGKATVARNRLSWGMPGLACFIYSDPSRNSPSGCVPSSGYGRITATPSTALHTVTMGNWSNFAGSYTVDAAAQITFSVRYTTAYNCGNSLARLFRTPFDAAARTATGPAVKLQEIAAPLTQSTGASAPFMSAKGTATFAPITLSNADNGSWRYTLTQSCVDAVAGGNRGGADVIQIDVAVPAPTVTFTVGGSVSGLTSDTLYLLNNGFDQLAISANGGFTFGTPVGAGLPYSVTVATQPSGQVCTVANGSGTASANVGNVAVACAPLGATAPITGYVNYTARGQVTLQNNGTDTLTVSSDNHFSFPTPIAAGSPYNVTVLSPPAGQSCVVQRGSGTAPQRPGFDVQVNCTDLPPSPLALLTYSNLNSLRTFKLDATTGAPQLPSSNSTTGNYPMGVTVAPNRQFAYVTNLLAGTVASYTIDAVLGQLTGTGSVSVPGPYAIALDPRSQFAWVLDNNNALIRSFTVDSSTGALTVSGTPAATATGGTRPHSLAVHPGGTYVYVTNELSNSVSAFQVNPNNGGLTLINTLANAVAAPQRIVVDPTGQFVYVASAGGNAIAVFQVNPSTGALAVAGSAITTSTPLDIAMHPSGSWLFVLRSGGAIRTFAIGPTGALTNAGELGVAEGATAMAINSAGSHLFLGVNGLTVFSISVSTGALTDTGFFDSRIGNTVPAGIALTP